MTIYIVDLYDASGRLSFQLASKTIDEAIEIVETQSSEWAIFKETLH